MYIIQRELEAEEIIYQNHIKYDYHLKVTPTLKEIKKYVYDWNNIEKDIREFYFKCPICEIRTSNPRKNYVIKHIETDYPIKNIKMIQCIWIITFQMIQIFNYDGCSFHKVYTGNFNEK